MSDVIASLKGSGFRGLVALMLVAGSVAAAAAPRQPGDPDLDPEQHFQLALESQSERQYGAMLSHLRSAASMGHIGAQETLGTVLLVGPNVYGKAVRADRCEARRWFLAAARSGSDFGRANVEFLNRTRGAPNGRLACEGVQS